MKNSYEHNFYIRLQSDVNSGDATREEAAMLEVVESNIEAAKEWDSRDYDYKSHNEALDSFQQNAVDTLIDDGIEFDDQDLAWLWIGAGGTNCRIM